VRFRIERTFSSFPTVIYYYHYIVVIHRHRNRPWVAWMGINSHIFWIRFRPGLSKIVLQCPRYRDRFNPYKLNRFILIRRVHWVQRDGNRKFTTFAITFEELAAAGKLGTHFPNMWRIADDPRSHIADTSRLIIYYALWRCVVSNGFWVTNGHR